MGKALDQTYAEMANGNASAPHITFDDFQNFINANDLEEALGKLTGSFFFPPKNHLFFQTRKKMDELIFFLFFSKGKMDQSLSIPMCNLLMQRRWQLNSVVTKLLKLVKSNIVNTMSKSIFFNEKKKKGLSHSRFSKNRFYYFFL